MSAGAGLRCCYSAGSIYDVRAEVKKTENGQMSQIAELMTFPRASTFGFA